MRQRLPGRPARPGRRLPAFPLHRHSLAQLLIDGALVALAWHLAFALRFDQGLPARYERLFHATLPMAIAVSVVVFVALRLYHKSWRYITLRDYEALVRAVAVATVALIGLIVLVHPVEVATREGRVAVTPPKGVLATFFLLVLALLVGARFAVHRVLERPLRGFRPRKDARSVLIVGAGDGGKLVLREILRNPDLGLRPVGFIDDDPRLRIGQRVASGLKVLGRTGELDRVLEEVAPDEVLIAIPSAPGRLRARVVSACRARAIPVRTLPTVFELLQNQDNVVRQVREIRVEDVLGREPVRMELETVGGYLEGERVLVTGAGGSIGAELCRQIARLAPARLILLDHAEDNLFEILRELEEERHVRGPVAVLADCKEEERMREVFAQHRPSAVFHAAAYKHVGLMQDNPVEAVRNNALATRLVARIAGESGVGTFVLVSTDKAVSAATVMGASKALAEWAAEAEGTRHPRTAYATVRFGNVLGSSGSVVPIFRRQIAKGGPVTVTDRRMTRYFMTIPEAVQLIIHAGSLARPQSEGGMSTLFVLDMGEPVPIYELAQDMIRLSGLEPGRDIAIDIVGRRPGEKLHEELFNPDERPVGTSAERILRVQRAAPLDPEWVERALHDLNLLALEGDAAGLAARVAELAAARLSVGGAVEAKLHALGETPLGGDVAVAPEERVSQRQGANRALEGASGPAS